MSSYGTFSNTNGQRVIADAAVQPIRSLPGRRAIVSVNGAAGVALMGQARGSYTFMTHLRWTWAIALGYAASIWVHLLING